MCLCSLPFPHNCWRWLAFVLGSGQLLSVRVENRLSLSVRASRHRPKACKTTPFPFLLDLYPSRMLFCPLCSRRSNRQTFPSLFSPARRLCSCLLSHDARTHLCTLRFISLVTALAPFTVRCTLKPCCSFTPESRSFFVASPAHFLSSSAPPARRPCGLFCYFLDAPERIAKTRMALVGVAPLSWTPCRCAGAK